MHKNVMERNLCIFVIAFVQLNTRYIKMELSKSLNMSIIIQYKENTLEQNTTDPIS